TENHVGDFPVIMPAIDVTSIGAGGGSVAWIDRDGVLKVGPHSAGARPGPACYGQGGADATVTDAYVALGVIDPAPFLGGRVKLDPSLADAALERLGRSLGLGVPQAAESVLRVATSQMYAALVPLMARKAVDLDRFALLPFGGAGPTHGFLLAREVGIKRVVVPPSPGVLCAIGSLVADVRRDFVRTIHEQLRRETAPALMTRIRDGFHALADEGGRWLTAQGLDFETTHSLWSVDLRYLGQSFELMIPVTDDVVADASGEACARRSTRATRRCTAIPTSRRSPRPGWDGRPRWSSGGAPISGGGGANRRRRRRRARGESSSTVRRERRASSIARASSRASGSPVRSSSSSTTR